MQIVINVILLDVRGRTGRANRRCSDARTSAALGHRPATCPIYDFNAIADCIASTFVLLTHVLTTIIIMIMVSFIIVLI